MFRMPLLKLETSVAVPDNKRSALLASLSEIVTEVTGKPEQYVMVTATQSAILMSGTPENTAFVDVRGIGLNADMNKQLARKISKLLSDTLGIAPNRTYLNFTDVLAENWGWNGDTFG